MCLILWCSNSSILFHIKLLSAGPLTKLGKGRNVLERLRHYRKRSEGLRDLSDGCLIQHAIQSRETSSLNALLNILSPLLVPISFTTKQIFALRVCEQILDLTRIIEFIATFLRPEPAIDAMLIWRSFRYFEEERLSLVISKLNERISRLEIFLDVISNCKVAAFLNPDIEDRNAVLDGIKATAITVTETATESTATLGIETAAQVLGQASIGVGITVLIDLALTSRSLYMAKKQKDDGIISDKEFSTKVKKKVCESGLQFVGGTTGSIVGQILIPIPVLGAFVGGLCGSLIGTGIGKGINYGIFDKMEKEAEIFSKTGPSVLVGSQLAVLEDVVSKKRRKNLTTLTRYNEETEGFEDVNLQQAFSFLDRIVKSYDVSSKRSPKQTSSSSFFPFTKSSSDRTKKRDLDETNVESIPSEEIKDDISGPKQSPSYSFFSFGRLGDKAKHREPNEEDCEQIIVPDDLTKETTDTSSTGSSFFSFALLGGKQKKKEEQKAKEVDPSDETSLNDLMEQTPKDPSPSEVIDTEISPDECVPVRSPSEVLEGGACATPPPSSPSMPQIDKEEFQGRKRADTISHMASLKSLLTFDFSSKDIQKSSSPNNDNRTDKKPEEPRKRQLKKRFTLSGISQLTPNKDLDSPKSPTLLENQGDTEGEIGKQTLKSPTRQRSFTLSRSPTRVKSPVKESSTSPIPTETYAKATDEHVSRILKTLHRTASVCKKETVEDSGPASEDCSYSLENQNCANEKQGDTDGNIREGEPSEKEKKSFRSSLFFEDSLGYLFGRKDSKRRKDAPSPGCNKQDEATDIANGTSMQRNEVGPETTPGKGEFIRTEQSRDEPKQQSESPSKFDYLFKRRSFRQRSSEQSVDSDDHQKGSGIKSPIDNAAQVESSIYDEANPAGTVTSPKASLTQDTSAGSSEVGKGKGDESIKTSISEGLEKFFGFRGRGRSKTESSIELKGVADSIDKSRQQSPKTNLSRSLSEKRGAGEKDVELHRTRSERAYLPRDKRKLERASTESFQDKSTTPRRTDLGSLESDLVVDMFDEEDEELLQEMEEVYNAQTKAPQSSKHFISVHKEKVLSAPEASIDREYQNEANTYLSFDSERVPQRPKLNKAGSLYYESISGSTTNSTNTQSQDWQYKRSQNLKRQQPFMDVVLTHSASSPCISRQASDDEDEDYESSLPFMDISPGKSFTRYKKSSEDVDKRPRSQFFVNEYVPHRSETRSQSAFGSNEEHLPTMHGHGEESVDTESQKLGSTSSAEGETDQPESSDLKDRLLSWVFTKETKSKEEKEKIPEEPTPKTFRRSQTLKSRPQRQIQNDNETQRKRNSSFNLFDFTRFGSEEKLSEAKVCASPISKRQTPSPRSPLTKSPTDFTDNYPTKEPDEKKKEETSGTSKKASEFPTLVKALTIFKLPSRNSDETESSKQPETPTKATEVEEKVEETIEKGSNLSEKKADQVKSKLREKQRFIDKIGLFKITKRDRSFEEASG